MKNIIKILFLSFVFVFTSCEEEENVSLAVGEGFIQFAKTSANLPEESSSPTTVTVVYGGSAEQNTNGITVDFEVTSSDNSRYTVSPSGGSVTIPAGQVSADITITPVDNFDVDGNVDVTVKLSTSSSKPIGLGGENVRFNEFVVTLIDNDCPININAFVGTYSVSENFTAGVNSPSGLSDFFGESYQLEMVLDPNDISGTQLVITNSVGFNTYVPDGTIIKFDTCNGKVSFDGQNQVNVALFRDFQYTDSSYSEADAEILCTGPLATFGAYQFTFTKQ